MALANPPNINYPIVRNGEPQRGGRRCRRPLGERRWRCRIGPMPSQLTGPAPILPDRGGSKRGFEPGLELGLGRGADLGRGGLAVLEQDHRRNAADAVAGRRVGIVVDVQFDDMDLVAKLAADLLQCRSDHPAGPAPFRPEIDEHRRLGADHVLMEAVVGNVPGAHFCGLLGDWTRCKEPRPPAQPPIYFSFALPGAAARGLWRSSRAAGRSIRLGPE